MSESADKDERIVPPDAEAGSRLSLGPIEELNSAMSSPDMRSQDEMQESQEYGRTEPCGNEQAGEELPPSYPPEQREEAVEAPVEGSWKQTLVMAVAAIVIVALFKTFILQWFAIPSRSMEDTLTVGDRVAVTMYDTDDIERGDIVVFSDPSHWLNVQDPTGIRGALRSALIAMRLLPEDSGHHLIKRVIGMPGDRVAVSGGVLSVNGQRIDEPYLRPGVSTSTIDFDVTVPEGHLWVMGDNRANSADSRYHQDDEHGGFVPMENVAGVARAVMWPLNRLHTLSEGTAAFAQVPGPEATTALPAGVDAGHSAAASASSAAGDAAASFGAAAGSDAAIDSGE